MQSHRAEQHLLLVAAGKLANLLLGARRLDGEALHEAVDDFALARFVDDSHARQARQDAERHVFAHRHVGNDPVGLAVLAAIADAERDRLGRLARRDVPAAQADRSRVGRIGAENRPRDFGPAGAEQAREADDLDARAPRRARRAPCVRSCSPSAASTTSPALGGGRGKAGRVRAHGLEVAPQHRRDEMKLVDLGHAARHHRAPVAHHGDPVADLIELVEPMGDEDDRHALGAQAAHDVEQHRDLAFVERGGRLVHDDEPRLERNRARNRDHLLDRGREFHQRPSHVDFDGEAPQQLGRFGVHPAPVEQAVTPVFAAEKDVLGDRAERNEVDFLIDGADAAALGVLRRREVDRLAAEHDRAAVSAIGAGQHLDHRRFSGAVLADQRHHLARLDLERGGGQRLHPLEALVDVAHDEERSGHRNFRSQGACRDRLQNAPSRRQQSRREGFRQVGAASSLAQYAVGSASLALLES